MYFQHVIPFKNENYLTFIAFKVRSYFFRILGLSSTSRIWLQTCSWYSLSLLSLVFDTLTSDLYLIILLGFISTYGTYSRNTVNFPTTDMYLMDEFMFLHIVKQMGNPNPVPSQLSPISSVSFSSNIFLNLSFEIPLPLSLTSNISYNCFELISDPNCTYSPTMSQLISSDEIKLA